MARLARVVIPGMPHHVTQRGNRRQQTFFQEDDYAAYRELTAQWCGQEGVEIWGYCLMDESYLLGAARYVELNPVRARLAGCAEEWPWSSARPHLSGCDDPLVKVAPLLALVADWRALLHSALPEEELRDLRDHGRTGRPLGNATFLERLERMLGRPLKPQKRGPKPKPGEN